ncbi:MAG: type II toxin-antitoxin system prevent-host-death family antitoxin, partial [Bifidobacteriaceae bacterium]|nr:type II toxin-antitoxin system prevent-host-death family antitoxin [Bifidobacteriaceae bacterium]
MTFVTLGHLNAPDIPKFGLAIGLGAWAFAAAAVAVAASRHPRRAVANVLRRCHPGGMEAIPLRKLRQDASAVVRRVEAGAELTVTVQGRPVARLVPLENRPRPRTMSG